MGSLVAADSGGDGLVFGLGLGLGSDDGLEGDQGWARAVVDAAEQAVADGTAEAVTGAADAARGAEKVLVVHASAHRIAAWQSAENRFGA